MLDFDWRTTNNCHQIQLCSSVIKSGYEFFDTYGNNGDIVSQVLSDMLLIQSALSKKFGNYIHNMAT